YISHAQGCGNSAGRHSPLPVPKLTSYDTDQLLQQNIPKIGVISHNQMLQIWHTPTHHDALAYVNIYFIEIC
ncbi:MAG: hypothetical protein IKK12_04360, partial [Clostridia bacterium]|nr:hypothetical protein [Clostridia bacterium]